MRGRRSCSGGDETFLNFYGDDWYEWLKERVVLSRAALHTWKLEFPHPETGQRMEFRDSLANDLRSFWKSVP